jgi:hypothetical protein
MENGLVARPLSLSPSEKNLFYEEETMEAERMRIIDDRGTIWSAEGPDAKLRGLELLRAAEQGRKQKYQADLGAPETWSGDLVLVQEIARIR